jgi:hypothetical protein
MRDPSESSEGISRFEEWLCCKVPTKYSTGFEPGNAMAKDAANQDCEQCAKADDYWLSEESVL